MTRLRNVPAYLYVNKPNKATVPKDIRNVRFGEVVAIKPGCMPYWWVSCDRGNETLRDARALRQAARRGQPVKCTCSDCVASRTQRNAEAWRGGL